MAGLCWITCLHSSGVWGLGFQLRVAASGDVRVVGGSTSIEDLPLGL